MQYGLDVLPQSITAGHCIVNTAGICLINTAGHKYDAMKKDSKRKVPTPEELAEQKSEGIALRAIYNQKRLSGWKIGSERLSQSSLGYHSGGMTQGMVNHLLEGRRRLSKEQAIKIANVLGVSVSDFSERLAKEIQAFTVAGINSQVEPENRGVERFTVKMREYRKKAIEQLISLPEHRVQEWLDYADFLRSKDPPSEQQGGGSGAL